MLYLKKEVWTSQNLSRDTNPVNLVLRNTTFCELERAEKLGHFTGGMAITRSHRNGDPGLEQWPGAFDIIETNEQLRELKIAGHVVGMVIEQLAEMLLRDSVLTIRSTAHRQTVPQEWIVWFGREKLFELFAS